MKQNLKISKTPESNRNLKNQGVKVLEFQVFDISRVKGLKFSRF
jgi:hypothetical protein